MDFLRKVIGTVVVLSVLLLSMGSANAVELAQETNAVKYNFEVTLNGKTYEPFTTTLAIGSPATLTYFNEDGSADLKIRVTAQLSKKSRRAIVSHSILQNLSGSWVELSAPIIEFSDKSDNGNVLNNIQDATEIIITGKTELVSVNSDLLSKSLKECTENQDMNLHIDNSIMQSDSCCGGVCGNGHRWQCCGAIACCNCDTCCQVP